MTYCIFSIITLLSFIIFGRSVENINSIKTYWKRSIIPICLYCLTLGFRKGWAVDYVVYNNLYMGTSKVGIESYEPMFRFFVLFLTKIFPDSSVPLFVLEALMMVVSILFLLYNHRRVIVFALPLFYFITAYQAANLVRYIIAMSFIYMAIPFLLDGKWKKCLLLFGISFFVHYSAAILIIFVLLIYKVPIFSNVKTNLVLYTLFAFISVSSIQQAMAPMITKFIMMLNLGSNQLAKYANEENVSTVLLGNRELTQSVSFFYTFCSVFVGYIYIIIGYKLCEYLKKERHFLFLYNVGVLGLILMQLSFGAEVFSRIAFFFYYTTIVFFSYIFKYRKTLVSSKFLFVLFVICMIYNCYSPIKGLYENFEMLYIWD